MPIYVNGIKVAGGGISHKSPYQIAVAGGFTGSEAEFNAALAAIGTMSGEIQLQMQVWHRGANPPENTKLFWIDTDTTNGGLKYYYNNEWVHVPTIGIFG